MLGEGQPVTVCDRIVVTIENSGRQTIMPALFFLDDKWNVFPRRPKCPIGLTVADRLEPGRRMSFDVPYNPTAFSTYAAPSTSNGVFVAALPFVEGETSYPNLCALTAFNDIRDRRREACSKRTISIRSFRAAPATVPRPPLDAGSLSLSFWPVQNPPSNSFRNLEPRLRGKSGFADVSFHMPAGGTNLRARSQYQNEDPSPA